MADLLALAGGATSEADLSRVNMAQRLRDGAHVHIPRMGEVQPPSASPQGAASVQPGKVNINTATVKELQSLPAIGEVRAQAIVDYRERNGPFLRPEDLLKVRGIGPGILQTIYHLITAE
jgi:competence protein ComEA